MVTMKKFQTYSTRMAAFAIGTVTLLGAGCASSPNGGQTPDTEYVLWVILEKNLATNQDNLSVQFLKDENPVAGGQVIVEGESITSFDANGKAQQSYTLGQWDSGVWIHIVALDSSGTVYNDSVIIPGGFIISNVDPANEPWRPSQPNPRIEWTQSGHAVRYAISVQGRTSGSAALGFAAYNETGLGLSQTFTQEVFSDNFGNVISDDYDIHVIAANPNFIAPDNPVYDAPDVPDIPSPIQSTDVTGGISALCVSMSESIVVNIF